MNARELIEVNVAKEYASEFLVDPILMMTINVVLNNAPKFNLVLCADCENSDGIECSKGKVWCNKMCRYMNKDGFCSEGVSDNEID